MSQVITLNLPEGVVSVAQEVAEQTHRPMEDVLVAWLEQVTTERPVETLPDAQVLALADLQMEPELQEELTELLYENETGSISDAHHSRLNEILKIYRKGMVRKSRALAIAVERGLRTPLD